MGKVWEKLEFDYGDIIKMVEHYTKAKHALSFESALECWEKAAGAVDKREKALEALAEFESNQEAHYKRLKEEPMAFRDEYMKLRESVEKKTQQCISCDRELMQFEKVDPGDHPLKFQGESYMERMERDWRF